MSDATERRTTLPDRIRSRAWVWPSLVAAVFLAEAVLLLSGWGRQWYYFDEWRLVVERVIPDPSGPRGWFEQLFRPDGEHVIAVPLALFVALTRWVGIDTYAPLLVANVVVRLLTLALVLDITRRLGARRAAQLAAVVVVAVFGAGYESLFGQSLIFAGFTLVFGLAAVRTAVIARRPRRWPAGLDRVDDQWWSGVSSSAWLVLAVFSSSYAFPLVVAVALVHAGRRWWRAAALSFVVPPVAFLVARWLAGGAYAQQQPVAVSRLPLYVDYVQAGLGTVGEGVTGLEGLGFTSFVLVLVFVVWSVRTRLAAVTAASLVLATALFYAQASLSRSVFGAEQATATRYAFFCGVLVLVAVAGAWGDRRFTTRSAVVACIVLAASLGSNLGWLVEGRSTYLTAMHESRNRLALGMVAADRGVSGFRPDIEHAPDLYDDRLALVLDWPGSREFLAEGARCYDRRVDELRAAGVDVDGLAERDLAALVLLLNEHALGVGANDLTVTDLLVLAVQQPTGSPVIDAFVPEYGTLVQLLPQIDVVPSLDTCF